MAPELFLGFLFCEELHRIGKEPLPESVSHRQNLLMALDKFLRSNQTINFEEKSVP